jgi:hypothetical protein
MVTVIHAAHSSVVPLPRPKREEIYINVRKVANNYAIDISVCGCMNPDIGGTCNIEGNWQVTSPSTMVIFVGVPEMAAVSSS